MRCQLGRRTEAEFTGSAQQVQLRNLVPTDPDDGVLSVAATDFACCVEGDAQGEETLLLPGLVRRRWCDSDPLDDVGRWSAQFRPEACMRGLVRLVALDLAMRVERGDEETAIVAAGGVKPQQFFRVGADSEADGVGAGTDPVNRGAIGADRRAGNFRRRGQGSTPGLWL